MASKEAMPETERCKTTVWVALEGNQIWHVDLPKCSEALAVKLGREATVHLFIHRPGRNGYGSIGWRIIENSNTTHYDLVYLPIELLTAYIRNSYVPTVILDGLATSLWDAIERMAAEEIKNEREAKRL